MNRTQPPSSTAKQPTDQKPVCRYGQRCYRRNPQHFQDYHHPAGPVTQQSDTTGDGKRTGLDGRYDNSLNCHERMDSIKDNDNVNDEADDGDDALLEIMSRDGDGEGKPGERGCRGGKNNTFGVPSCSSVPIPIAASPKTTSKDGAKMYKSCSLTSPTSAGERRKRQSDVIRKNDDVAVKKKIKVRYDYLKLDDDEPCTSRGLKSSDNGGKFTKIISGHTWDTGGATEDGITVKHRKPNRITPGESPFSFYFTSVRGLERRWNAPDRARSMSQILAERSDDLRSSAQFNFMVDVPWLVDQYPPACRDKPLLIVTGEKGESLAQMRHLVISRKNIQFASARLDIPYGTHHTKMMLLRYSTAVRVVVHTANLVESDWDQKSQAIWMSPFLPVLEEDRGIGTMVNGDQSCSSGGNTGTPPSSSSVTNNDSPTGFKMDLLSYLRSYGLKCLLKLIETIEKTDFRSVNVFLVASTPGRFGMSEMNEWGHMKMRKILTSHCRLPTAKSLSSKGSLDRTSLSSCGQWPVVAQFSSIGSLGPTPESWMKSDFLASLSAVSMAKIGLTTKPAIKLIFPSVDDVRMSLEGFPAGASIPYHNATAVKQPYLRDFMHRWRAEIAGRSRASPHVKTYARFSPDFTKLAWFCVTSANLSKAAWGAMEKQGMQLMIRSYELGVVFIPEFFPTFSSEQPDGTVRLFDVSPADGGSQTVNNASTDLPWFPLPYDVPLTPYVVGDQPWILDLQYTDKPDTNGNIWYPR